MARKAFEFAFTFGAAMLPGMKSAFSGASGLVDTLGQKVKDLDKAKGNIPALKTIEKSLKDNVAAFRKMEAGAKKDALRKKIVGQQKSLTTLRKELKGAGVNLRDLAREEERLARETDKAREAHERWAKVTQEQNRFLSATSSTMRSTAKSFAVMTGAATAVVGAGYAITSAVGAAGDEAAKTAFSLGLTTEGLQELRYAAGLSGLSVQQFDNAIKTMEINVAKAADGQGKAVKTLEELGISATRLANTPMDTRMKFLADAIAKIEDPAKRTRAAVALFGSDGLRMVKMLEEGRKGLAAMRAEARQTGNVLSDKAAKDAEDFIDAQHKLKHSLIGVRNTIGVELLPVFTDAFGTMSSEIIGNRDLVQSFAKSFASGVKELMPNFLALVTGMGKVAHAGYIVGGTVVDLVGGFENFGKLVGLSFFAKPIWGMGRMAVSAFSLVKAFGSATGVFTLITKGVTAFNAALMANPIIAVAVAAGAAVYLIYKNWDSIVGYFTGKIDAVKAAFEKGFVQGISEILVQFDPVRMVADTLSGLVNYMTGWNVDLWKSMTEAPERFFAWLTGKFAWLQNSISKVSGAWDSITNLFGGGDETEAPKPFAAGGVVTRPTLALVGEGGSPESIIPHDGSSRSLGLWAQAGRALGVDGFDRKNESLGAATMARAWPADWQPAKPDRDWDREGERHIRVTVEADPPTVPNPAGDAPVLGAAKALTQALQAFPLPGTGFGRGRDERTGAAPMTGMTKGESEAQAPWQEPGKGAGPNLLALACKALRMDSIDDAGNKALQLWSKAGEAVASALDTRNRRPVTPPITITLSPRFDIKGNADEHTIRSALTLTVDQLRTMIDELLRENSRAALA